jgi:hypothetical protein
MTNFLGSVPADAIDTEDDDTIEMELSESAMQMLSQAAALAEQPCPSPNPTPPNLAPALKDPDVQAIAGETGERGELEVRSIAGEWAPREPRPAMSRLRLAILLSTVAVASALLTAVTYIATTRTVRPAPVAASVVSSPPAPVIVASPPSPPPPPASSTESAEPVRFVNPFDRKEVFEFPAGTSKADARDAVAELLYERAQERRDSARGIVSGLSVRHPTNATAAAAPAARKAAP